MSFKRPQFELADVLRLHGQAFRSHRKLSLAQHQAFHAIEHCRTGAFGAHIQECDSCCHREQSYNSCRNRHCPKCQGSARDRWVEARLSELLPIPYYHVVFTIPSQLNGLCQYNESLMYSLLFEASSETLKVFGQDEKWLGGELGFFGILHTWGQNLWYHPHIHYVVSGGGLGKDGQWKEPKFGGKFLFPVHALSQVFRGKFLQGLRRHYRQHQLAFPPDSPLEDPVRFEQLLSELHAKKWVVYAKAPFRTPESVVRYIGRYSHRVAISNHRLVALDAYEIQFRYRDYRDGGNLKVMTLTPDHFLERFLWHILPQGFRRIRSFGFLAAGHKSEKLPLAYQAIQAVENAKSPSKAIEPKIREPKPCPFCQEGALIPQASIQFSPFSPFVDTS